MDDRSRRDRQRKRLDRLDKLSPPGNVGVADLSGRARVALEAVRAEGRSSPGEIAVRSSFLRLAVPVPGPVADGRPRRLLPKPPLPNLIAPRSVALQLELVALFVAQHRRLTRGGAIPLGLSVEAQLSGEVGWADLVVAPSEHDRQAKRAVRTSGNRIRQVRSALDRLSKDDVSLFELPRTGTHRKYDDAVLLDEGGTRKVGPPLPYRLPAPNEKVVVVPLTFWLNGWVHALTDSEIAAWLMFRQLRADDIPAHDRDGVAISGARRLQHYGLSEETWNSHRMLARLGLLEAESGPGRRPDGTLEDFEPGTHPPLHRFRITDSTLSQPAVPVIRGALTAMLAHAS